MICKTLVSAGLSCDSALSVQRMRGRWCRRHALWLQSSGTPTDEIPVDYLAARLADQAQVYTQVSPQDGPVTALGLPMDSPTHKGALSMPLLSASFSELCGQHFAAAVCVACMSGPCEMLTDKFPCSMHICGHWRWCLFWQALTRSSALSCSRLTRQAIMLATR